MIYSFDEFELDEDRFELRRAGAKVPVQPKVLEVLLGLVRSRGSVVSKADLIKTVWGGGFVSDPSLAQAIMHARRAIDDADQTILVTVRGRGFRFEGRVTEREGRAATALRRPAADASIVGREACFAAVAVRLDEALAGRGGSVLIAGEAGIGKTRVVEEIARRAKERGAKVLFARAHDSPGAPSMWLWTQLVDEVEGADGDAAATELRAALSSSVGGAPNQEQALFATCAATSRALTQMSRSHSLVIALDDLQWADDASLQLFDFLAHDIGTSPLLLVGACRDGVLSDDARGRALARVLGDSGTTSIPLRGLTRGEVVRFVEATAGVAPTEALVDAHMERSGGNPLYVRELLKTEWAARALDASAQDLATSMDLQQGLLESVARHLDALSDGARQLLMLAAVLGREFDLARLGIVSGVAPAELLNGLDEAVKARLLVPPKRGVYRFAHLLVRDALYKKTPAADRAARHKMVGERLLAAYGDIVDAHASELAHHFSRALPGGDAALALDLAIRAADQATERGLDRDAVSHWRQAAAALTLVHGAPEGRARAVAVHLGLAHARQRAGHAIEAREAFLDAALLAKTLERPHELAEAALGLATIAETASEPRRRWLLEARAALASRSDDRAIELKRRLSTMLDE
ncbi:MAG: AAA family ATPase [Polyangiales bacterium]